MRITTIRVIRFGVQALFLIIVLHAALGLGSRTFENFCPFGGVEALYGLFTTQKFTCALAPLNLAMFIGVVALTVVSKRSFCGWVCPIGFIGEWINKLGDKVWKKRPRIPRGVGRYLRLLRYVVLALVLYYTYTIGDLIFRGYDPFYLIFSGFGHESLGWISFSLMGIFVVGSFFEPMFFCKYFCPLAAVLDPFSKVGLIKIKRNVDTCTDCTLCNKKCHFGVEPMSMKSVSHRDCVNCFECVEACPIPNCLEVKAP